MKSGVLRERLLSKHGMGEGKVKKLKELQS
jgi:hypothetical protein